MSTRLPGIPLLAALLLLAPASARTETYQVLEGTLSVGDTSEALTGFLELVLTDTATPELTLLQADDFVLQAGDQSFEPNPPVEYEGMKPILFLEIADQIQLYGDDVGLVRLRTGGDVVAFEDDRVTFRFLDFRQGPSGGGSAVGQLGDSELPRRLYLEGVLYEVDQTFEIRPLLCPLPTPIPLPPRDGGVIIGSDLHLSFNRFDLRVEEIVSPTYDRAGVISRLSGGGSIDIIRGDLTEIHGSSIDISGGGLISVGSAAVLPGLGLASAGSTPTLEELGITAPAGATVGFDETTGELWVDSEGDLFVEGTAIDLPGLTLLSIRTSGEITITGDLVLPPGAALYLEAAAVYVDGLIEAPGGIEIVTDQVPDPGPDPDCRLALWPIFPAPERAVGTYSLVASAARQVEVDVQSRRRRNHVQPGQPQPIWAAILGADDLDVRDIDETTLRFGPGEAEPAAWRGREPTRVGRVDSDPFLDLLARFDVRDAGIAYGDTEVCLVAETTDGETLEGCDRIRTLPEWLSSSLRRRDPTGF
jgi:hypothetical protein